MSGNGRKPRSSGPLDSAACAAAVALRHRASATMVAVASAVHAGTTDRSPRRRLMANTHSVQTTLRFICRAYWCTGTFWWTGMVPWMARVDGFDTADRIFSSLSLLIGWPEATTSNAYEVRSVHPIDDRAQRVRSAVRASRRGSVRRKTGVARLGALLSLDGLGPGVRWQRAYRRHPSFAGFGPLATRIDYRVKDLDTGDHAQPTGTCRMNRSRKSSAVRVREVSAVRRPGGRFTA